MVFRILEGMNPPGCLLVGILSRAEPPYCPAGLAVFWGAYATSSPSRISASRQAAFDTSAPNRIAYCQCFTRGRITIEGGSSRCSPSSSNRTLHQPLACPQARTHLDPLTADRFTPLMATESRSAGGLRCSPVRYNLILPELGPGRCGALGIKDPNPRSVGWRPSVLPRLGEVK